jgi:hypothetical protein
MFSLQPYGIAQIHRFLWEALQEDGVHLFNKHLRRNRGLAALAANPFMLSMIVALSRSRPGTHLSASSAKLFHQYVMQSIHGAANPDPHDGASAKAIVTLLARVAFEMQERQHVSTSIKTVREWPWSQSYTNLEAMLEQAAQWGLLKPVAGGTIEFPHTLLLHYFAALHLNTELRRGQGYEQVVGSRLLRKHWANVIALLTGVMDQAGEMIHWLASALRNPDRQIQAITPALMTPDAPPRARGDAVREWGERLRDSVARVLAHVGPPAVNELVNILSDEDPNARWRAVEVLGHIGNSAATAPLMLSIRDPNIWVRKSAISALGEIGDPNVIQPLEGLARSPSEDYLRQVAADVLTRLSKTAEPAPEDARTTKDGRQADVVEALERYGGTRNPLNMGF